MTTMTDDELQHLTENFETTALLTAVDRIDLVRGRLRDEGLAPPEMRDDLLKLHGMAMDVVNNGFVRHAPEMFSLADDLSGQVFDLIEALQEVQDTLDKLVGLQPEEPDE